MECKKCEIEIPSNFEFVLTNNMCPKCGNKLMNDAAMKVYADLKKRLGEVELVMDPNVTRERIAMFLINNYEVVPFGSTSRQVVAPVTAAEKNMQNQSAVEVFKAQLASIAASEGDMELTAEEIRAEEAARAEDLAIAREMGLDPDEEIVTGLVDHNKVQRLKKLAQTGQVGMIKRSGA